MRTLPNNIDVFVPRDRQSYEEEMVALCSDKVILWSYNYNG